MKTNWGRNVKTNTRVYTVAYMDGKVVHHHYVMRFHGSGLPLFPHSLEAILHYERNFWRPACVNGETQWMVMRYHHITE